MALFLTPWTIPRVSLPGPIDGILQEVPMADILGVISRSWKDVLRSMEIYHGVLLPYDDGYIRQINTLEQVFAAHFRQSYIDRDYQGDGERTRNEHHRLMTLLLYEIIASDYEYREALYVLIRYLEVGEPTLILDWNERFASPEVFLDYMVSNFVQPHLMLGMKFWGNRRVRRRNKQRWRRALHRVTCAKANLLSCIRGLIREAMLYHLICSIRMVQDRLIELSDVSREIDVTVIKVMIPLFPCRRYWVTSYIDLDSSFFYFPGRFVAFVKEPVTQDGDGDEPRKYLIRSRFSGLTVADIFDE